MGTVTERGRMALRQWAEQQMNEEAAETLMDALRPVSGGDLDTDFDRYVPANRFTAQLETEMDKIHEMFEEVLKALDDLRRAMRLQTITLSVTIIVAFLGQPVMARYLPPPALPAPRIIIQSPGG